MDERGDRIDEETAWQRRRRTALELIGWTPAGGTPPPSRRRLVAYVLLGAACASLVDLAWDRLF